MIIDLNWIILAIIKIIVTISGNIVQKYYNFIRFAHDVNFYSNIKLATFSKKTN